MYKIFQAEKRFTVYSMISQYVYLSLLYVVIKGSSFVQEVCVTDYATAFVHLNKCSSNSMIHVGDELIGKAANGDVCSQKTTGACNIGRANTDTGLTVNCNGQHICTEAVENPVDRCNSTKRSVKIIYQCIRESKDMCKPIDEVIYGSVLLHSPGYPDSVGVSAMCSCTITGSQMRVELLELYSRHVLNISADGVQVWPAPKKLPAQYNTPVINNSANSLILVYAGVSEHVKQNAWVKITGNGSSSVRVTCSGNKTEITSPASATSSTSPTTSSSSSEDLTTASSSRTSLSSIFSKMSTDNTAITYTPTSTVSETVSTDTNLGSTLAISAVSEGNSLPIEMIAGIAGGGGLLLIFTVVVSIVACRLKRKGESDKTVSNLERQEDYSTVDGDPVGNGNPYVDTPTTDRHSALRSYRFQKQSGDGSGKDVANTNHDNNNHDVYNKIIHPKLKNSAPTEDFESEQHYNHIPTRNDTDKSSQNNGHGLDVDDYDDTYNTNIRLELKDREKHTKDSEQTYDHIPSSTPVGASKDITNDTSSNTYYNISGQTLGISDNEYNSEQTYVHLASTGANNKSAPKCPPNPSKTEVSSDVSAMYTTVVRPPGHTSTENRNDGQQKDSPDSIPMGVLTSESKLAVEDADIYYKPPVPDKLFSEDDADEDEDEEDEMEMKDAENWGSTSSVASNSSSFSNKVPPVKEKPVMEDNDLYHTYKPPIARKPNINSTEKTQSVGRPEPERPEMVDNDLYHSYKK